MPVAPKRTTEVKVRVDLAKRARQLGIDLSVLLEDAIERAIREVEQTLWLDANRDAIRDANDHFEKHGLFSDERRGG